MSGRAGGLVARFSHPEALVAAAGALRRAGHRRLDAHTPVPVHGLSRALGSDDSSIARWVLAASLVGGAAATALQVWASAVAYPLVVSGKPLVSWPAFVPIAFECAVLGGAAGAVIGFLRGSGLPRLHHPLFAVDGFERATDDAFFLAVEAADDRFDREATRRLLLELGARSVEDVPG